MLSRARADAIVESNAFQRTVLAVIAVNAIAVGMETSPGIVDGYGPLLRVVELVVVSAFVCEIAFRLYARGKAFFRDPWNWFDLIVVAAALVPTTGFFTVVRIFRVLRLARLVSAVPSLRRVVAAMFAAVPNLASIIAMLGVALYTGAVLGTQLFRDVPQYFGSLDRSLFTMFEIMTVENWPEVADAVIDAHPAGWVFFVTYLVIVAFILLNLLIGVIVSAMEIEVNRERWEADTELERVQHEAVIGKLDALERQVATLQRQLELTGAARSPEAGGDGSRRS